MQRSLPGKTNGKNQEKAPQLTAYQKVHWLTTRCGKPMGKLENDLQMVGFSTSNC